MGSGMAANLIKAGHEVTAYNRSQDKVAALASQGARPRSHNNSPSQCANKASPSNRLLSVGSICATEITAI